MAIKRIQLRGISRAPSDRMTEDGGVAESLNVCLDNGEVAPIVTPKEIKSKEELPYDGGITSVYVHKIRKDEQRYICVLVRAVGTTYIIAISDPEEPYEAICILPKDETLRDISSVGNTLVIATDKHMRYALYNNGKYLYLGENAPKVSLSFVNVAVANQSIDTVTKEEFPVLAFGEEESDYIVTDPEMLEILKSLWESYQKTIGLNLKAGCFNAPVMVRYAIQLYDGTYWEASPPILVGGAFNVDGGLGDGPLKILIDSESSDSSGELFDYTFKVVVRPAFRIGVYKYIDDRTLENWKDIIRSVDVFIAPMTELYPNGQTHAKVDRDEDDNRIVVLDPGNSQDEKNIENAVLSTPAFYRVKSFSLQDLASSDDMEVITGDMTGENLATNDIRLDELKIGGSILAQNLSAFNNRVMAIGGATVLPFPLPALNGQHAYEGSREFRYAFRYYKDSADGERKVIYSSNFRDPSLGATLTADEGTYAYLTSGLWLTRTSVCEPFAFISYPDSGVTGVDVCKMSATGEVIGECYLDMKPHPFVVNCSYAWIGLGKSLADLEYAYKSDDFQGEVAEDKVEDASNKLFLSSSSNPFLFPSASRYTFGSSVIGAALARTAMSEGQYGQFPLYVFTEDGVWVMKAAEDGSFVSQESVSREICSNNRSVTPLDQSVVFTTKKGVMLLQGSQITELSPYMNGRHYAIDAVSKAIIQNQEGFSEHADILTDQTRFLQFMQNAHIAYDYVGKRIVCINPDEKYQYVYKLDTQTWHKLSHSGYALTEPLNSYPNCEVLGTDADGAQVILDISATLTSEDQRTEKGVIATRPFDLDEPDVLKTITDVRIRGQYPKGAVKFILQGSMDGMTFYTISTLRGKSWKLFRIIILADLDATDRISWIDIQYETKFTNRLR